MASLNLSVLGMTCGNCARTVERKLYATPGVTKVTVALEQASATVEYDTSRVQPNAIADAIRQLGYEVPV